eukprot:3941744-Rhodomonas_salina.2
MAALMSHAARSDCHVWSNVKGQRVCHAYTSTVEHACVKCHNCAPVNCQEPKRPRRPPNVTNAPPNVTDSPQNFTDAAPNVIDAAKNGGMCGTMEGTAKSAHGTKHTTEAVLRRRVGSSTALSLSRTNCSALFQHCDWYAYITNFVPRSVVGSSTRF